MTLADAADILGERPIALGRELTKRHQEIIRGTASEVRTQIWQPKGEITVIIGPENKPDSAHDQFADATAVAMAVERFGQLTNTGHSRRAAMTEAAKAFDLPARLVYAAVEAAKKSGQ
jgi:16S rRNA (cytidine1402-2'-O)-methyltransferase